jgi:Cysteine-rich secretory protein family
MKTWRVFRTAAEGVALCFLFFISTAHAQDHSPNRPPNATAPGTAHPSPDEKFLLDAANRERAAAGLQPLHWDSALAEAARRHAEVMASQNLLLHQCLDEAPLDQRAAEVGAKFSTIAENIAVGPNVTSVHEAWMNSPGHRHNILNADVTAVGIATARTNGGLFAVQDFSRPVEALSLAQQEERLISLLKAAGVQRAAATEDARKTCAVDNGFMGGDHPAFMTRFEVSDLSKLPDELLRKIKGGVFRSAAVGACQTRNTDNFARYRLAVLLN